MNELTAVVIHREATAILLAATGDSALADSLTVSSSPQDFDYKLLFSLPGKGVDIRVTDMDLVLSVADFSERFIKPAVHELVLA